LFACDEGVECQAGLRRDFFQMGIETTLDADSWLVHPE